MVMLLGGLIGLVIMRFAARQFVVLLDKYPALETAAFLIVGWVGVKLVVLTLAHKNYKFFIQSFPIQPLEYDILGCSCWNRTLRLSRRCKEKYGKR